MRLVFELWQVCINEWTKLIRRKRLWVALILAALIVALFAYTTHEDAASALATQSPGAVQQQIQEEKAQLAQFQAQPQTANIKQMESGLTSELQSLQHQYQQLQHPGEWQQTVRQEIQQDKQQLSTPAATPQDRAQQGLVKVDLLQLNYELNHGVAPVLPWKTSVYQSLQHFLDIVSSIFLPLLVVVVAADMVSGETTSGTIKLLLIRPVSRTRILLGKWLAALFATAVLTLGTCAAMLLAGMAIVGNTGARAPQVVGIGYQFVTSQLAAMQGGNSIVAIPQVGHASVLPIWEFVVLEMLLITLGMFMMATLAFFCSVLFKSSMASTAVAIGVVIVGNIAESLIQKKFMALLFTSHLNPANDWTGQSAQTFHWSLGLGGGLLVMALWTLVALGLSLWKFQRQDILNA